MISGRDMSSNSRGSRVEVFVFFNTQMNSSPDSLLNARGNRGTFSLLRNLPGSRVIVRSWSW